MVKVLFVCMGNICRSPTAEAVFRHQTKVLISKNKILVDSAGTHDYHIGEPPDGRAQKNMAMIWKGYVPASSILETLIFSTIY